MRGRYAFRSLIVVGALLVATLPAFAQQTAAQKPFEPQVGQAGKDVVWVPTPQALVDKMLDMAKVTPQDFLMDLGSGDGRTVITAAKRGARALGIEFNPNMVALSQKNAAAAGMTARAAFQNADLFEADLSKAQVITMFLLPSINMKLRPKLLDLRPGTRVVSNTFTMEDWEADETQTISGDCTSWCTALLWIVPAKVEGTWKVGQNPLVLKQRFQMLSGTLGSTAIASGRVRGDEVTFTAGNATYTGRVAGNAITGAIKGGSGGTFTATK
ncbi:MAG: class I SAM-dependent methyltransferase [Acidobacteria bacterium]|nr:class I SAM-dependent methyltransferase [Acidobacteriota bacterium]